jgi:hypothetical protein
VRAARTRLLGSLTPKTGCAPPAHRSFAASYSARQKIKKGLFSFNWTKEAMKYVVPPDTPHPTPPRPSLYLSSDILGSNYVPVRPYALTFSFLSFLYSFFIFYFCVFYSYSSLFFNFVLIISSYSSRTILRLLILLFLYFKRFNFYAGKTHIGYSDGFFQRAKPFLTPQFLPLQSLPRLIPPSKPSAS